MTSLPLVPLNPGTSDPTQVGIVAAYPDAPWSYPDEIFPDENSISELTPNARTPGAVGTSVLSPGVQSLPAASQGVLTAPGASQGSLGTVSSGSPGTLTLTPR